jgi:transposase-like protein
LLIWCWQHKYATGATRQLAGVSYLTVQQWFKRFRLALPKDRVILSGLVEADESAFGKQRFGKQTWVVGAIERDTRRIALHAVEERDRPNLERFVTHSIKDGSHINTDAWGAYNELNLLGYTHDFCNHSIGHFGLTNMIENLWSVMKRHLRAVYGYKLSFDLQDLNLILNEWEIRQNQPELMYNVTNYLHATVCSGLL